MLIALKPGWTQRQVAEALGVDQRFIGNVQTSTAAKAVVKGVFEDRPQIPHTQEPRGRGRQKQNIDIGTRIGTALKADAGATDLEVAAKAGADADDVREGVPFPRRGRKVAANVSGGY